MIAPALMVERRNSRRDMSVGLFIGASGYDKLGSIPITLFGDQDGLVRIRPAIIIGYYRLFIISIYYGKRASDYTGLHSITLNYTQISIFTAHSASELTNLAGKKAKYGSSFMVFRLSAGHL